MYKNIIDVRKDTPQDKLKTLAGIADRAFDNRAGKVDNTSDTPYRFIYRADEKLFVCLQLGMLTLEKNTNFLPYVSAWIWIDENDPDENEDILAEIQTSIN
ncbi:hypothetical protein HMPREF9333_00030 [Johnsonella ignava ATCC 51276]|uniref:Uncharacterized protein n=1 Tax=Johnsonella ignava ATCC 51276 TaxID=679200 RepID=G5GEP2_9FIRM|nr:hypothetical protein [Johnsonella ignava]EHI56828.1 hypothetical protein HMPREF9333_00030 [Johnsonella ignava ATCC 51276]